MNAEGIRRCAEEKDDIAADRNDLSAHVPEGDLKRAMESLDKLAKENDHLRKCLKVALQLKRPANVLENEVNIAEHDEDVVNMVPRADQLLLKAEQDADGGSILDLTERETKRPRLHNEAHQSDDMSLTANTVEDSECEYVYICECGQLLANAEDDAHICGGDNDAKDDGKHEAKNDNDEEEKDGDEEENADEDEEGDGEDDDEEEDDTFAMDDAGSGCLRFKASVIDSSLKSGKKIGSGGYGAVYKASINGEEVAIKVMHSTSAFPTECEKHFREFETEVNILGQIKHPNLVRLIGSCKKKHAIIYEYLANGTLEELIEIHKKTFLWDARVNVAYNICKTLVYLHSRSEPVVHGDLKPSNILFDSSNMVKLGDFGISRVLTLKSGSGTRMHQTMNKPKGTKNYIDPHFFRTGQLTSHSDTFAFGIIILQLVTGKTANDLVQFVTSGVTVCESHEPDKEKVMKKLKQAKLIDIALRKNLSDNDTLDAFELLKLGLECCRIFRSKRPSLVDEVLPKLKELNGKLQHE